MYMMSDYGILLTPGYSIDKFISADEISNWKSDLPVRGGYCNENNLFGNSGSSNSE